MDQATEEMWRERIGEQKKSGETVAGFCRERGLKEWAFYEWRRKLGMGGRGLEGSRVRSRFVRVGGSSGVLRAMPRVELPNGVRIELGGGLESEAVRVFLLRLCGLGGEEVGHARA